MAVDYAAVGVLIGDPANATFGTASIYTLSTLYGENSFTLAAAAARSLAGQYAAQVNKRAGDVSIDASDKFKHYSALAKTLESKAAVMSLGSTGAYAGGISKSDKETRESNTDRVQPKFTRDLHRDPSLSDVDDYDDLT